MTESYEYRVIETPPGNRSEIFAGMAHTTRTLEEIQAYLAWLTGPNLDNIRAMAKEEEADPSSGNFARVELKRREGTKYRIVRRTVSEWEDALDVCPTCYRIHPITSGCDA